MLGVLVDNKLKFSKHVEEQVSKANRILGLFRRSYQYLDNETMRLLFNCSCVTSFGIWKCLVTTFPEGQAMIESVLRRVTKLVPGLGNHDYRVRLKCMNLPSMKYRRKRGSMIEIYKYTHGLYSQQQSLCIEHCNSKQAEENKVLLMSVAEFLLIQSC